MFKNIRLTFKNLKLIQKVSSLALLILIINLGIQSILLLNIRDSSLKNASVYVDTVSNDLSFEITQTLAKTEQDMNQLSQDFSQLIAQRKISRSDALHLLQNRLQSDPNIIGFGLGFEPNAFDQADTAHQMDVLSGSNESGRFLAYVTRGSNDQPVVEPLTGYDVPGDGDWYLQPKATGLPTVTEPYLYTVGGKEVTMFTISYPILNAKGQFLGTLTADIALDQMQNFFANNESLNREKAIAVLFTEKGHIISSTIDPKDVNQIQIDDPLIKNVLSGKNKEVYTANNLQDKGAYLTSDGLVTFRTGTNWHLVSAIPEKIVLKSYEDSLFQSMILIGIAIVIILLLILGIGKSINKPIQKLMRIMKQVELGDLTEFSALESKDEIGQLSSSFDKMLSSLRELIAQVQNTSGIVEDSSDNLTILSRQNALSISEVNTIVGQIADANIKQAEDIESIVGRTAVLGDMINESSEVINALNTVAARTNQISSQGVQTLGDLEQKSHETKALSQEINRAVTDVNLTINQIEDIAKLIDNIASQTNLLALNASIEAARAGEAGRGFSVVADEIRSLSEQTTLATQEIRQLIITILNKSAIAVRSVSEVSAAQESEYEVIHTSIDIFQEIISAFQKISEQLLTIQGNSHVIENSKNDILDALTNISALTQETTASTEEVTSTMNEQKESIDQLTQHSENLSVLTESLKSQVVSFRI